MTEDPRVEQGRMATGRTRLLAFAPKWAMVNPLGQCGTGNEIRLGG